MGPRIDIVGTRIDGASSYVQLIEECARNVGHEIHLASAYWDATALGYVRDAASRSGSMARVLLWTHGGSKGAWRKSEFVRDDPWLDVRFVDSPDEEGIFHVKLGGVAQVDGNWTCAVVGSCNLTARALSRNVELGVVIRDDATALEQLRAWFDLQFTGASRASDIDWSEAIERAPESIAKLHGQGEHDELELLAPRVHATGIVAPPQLT